MTTINDLLENIATAFWFQELGRFPPENGVVSLKNLDAWRETSLTGRSSRSEYDAIADKMVWLPCSYTEKDTIHGVSLEVLAEREGVAEQLKRESLNIYKATLRSLRDVPENPALIVGPHNFVEAAKGAAAFAARRAAYEIGIGKQDFWCSVMSIYFRGNWPCALMPDKKLVVF